MNEFLYLVDSYAIIAFGIWTILNLIKTLSIPMITQCYRNRSAGLLDLNYELLLMFGTFPAIILFGSVLLAIILFPYVVYTIYSHNR